MHEGGGGSATQPTRRVELRDAGREAGERLAGSLSARGVGVVFGDFKVLQDIDLTVSQGQIVGLIGPNGAGKTTLVNVLSGFQRQTAGDVLIDHRTVTRWGPARRARAGLSRTFQGGRLFAELTCRENLTAAALASGQRPAQAHRVAEELLERIGLGGFAGQPARTLAYGHTRLLAIARSLATRPRFVLLDEPAAGLNEAETPHLVELVRDIPNAWDCGVMIIEHDMPVIMSVCDHLIVLDHGRLIAAGDPEEVRTDPEVRRAYLGTAG